MTQALGISKKGVKNSFKLINSQFLIYFLESSLIVKDIQQNTYKQFFKEGCLNNIIMIETIIAGADKPFIVIAEEQKKNLLISLINLKDQSKWEEFLIPKTGTLLALKLSHLSKLMYLLFQQNPDEQIIIAYNYVKRKVIGRQISKMMYKSIQIHPLRQKISLMMGDNILKMFEIKTQNKNFVEKQQLLFSKNEKEERYLDLCWNVNKKTYYLIVLCNNNSLILFQEEKLIKKIKLDLSIVSFTTFSLNRTQPNSYEELFHYDKETQNDELQKH